MSGMTVIWICPECGSDNIRVRDSRGTGKPNLTRRRRRCMDCDSGMTTYEVPAALLKRLPFIASALEPMAAASRELLAAVNEIEAYLPPRHGNSKKASK